MDDKLLLNPNHRNVNRQTLVELQRSMFEDNRSRIAEYEQILTRGFNDYEENYNQEVQAFERVTSIGPLMHTIRGAKCVLVGDYHTLSIAQKSFLKLMRRVKRSRVVIGLELFGADTQEAVDGYVVQGGAERTLLRRSKVVSRWPYQIWKNFKPIVDLAQQRKWRVAALDSPRDASMTLKARDQFMAARLLDLLQDEHPNTLALILVGELHVASGHMPKAIMEEAESRHVPMPQPISIFQNPGPIYWKLVDAQLEQETEVVQLDDHRFAINSAPPLVVQQSYLNWIDYNAATLEYDHLSRHFRKVVQNIQRALSIRSTSQVNQMIAYGPGDFSFLDELDRKNRENSHEQIGFEKEKYKSQLYVNERIIYLSNLNINHVGEVAGRLIHALAIGKSLGAMKGFYSFVIHNAIAFFASKIVNPKRKAHQLPYFREQLRSVGPENPIPALELEVASAILLHKQFERGKRSRAFQHVLNGQGEKLDLLVQELGYMLGEKLYYAFNRGRLSRGEIRNLIQFPMDDPEQSAALYFSVSRQVDRERIPIRM
jgi:hypothetical protein